MVRVSRASMLATENGASCAGTDIGSCAHAQGSGTVGIGRHLRAAFGTAKLTVMAHKRARRSVAPRKGSARRAFMVVGGLCLAATAALAEEAPPRARAPAVAMRGLPSLDDEERGRTAPDWVAVQGGAVLFGVAYGAAMVTAGRNGFRDDTGWLALPVAGPWVSLWGGSTLSGWALAADGIAQLGGGTLLTMGFASPRTTLGPAQAGVQESAPPVWVLARERPRTLWLQGVF